jgi:GNAT superfamily N-acetyltransferase
MGNGQEHCPDRKQYGRFVNQGQRALPLIWRTERIFLPLTGRIERVGCGWRIVSPDNPTYWWGNALVMDRAPGDGDLERWQTQFRDLIHKHQPHSRHMAFSWEGPEAGVVEPFMANGFVLSKVLVMRARHLNPAPPPRMPGVLRAFDSGDWPKLVEALVSEAHPSYSAEVYRQHIEHSVANWRRLADADRGNWFGAFHGDKLISTLGIFVEAQSSGDGERLARFQHVMTAVPWQRQGLCLALAYEAARQSAIRYAPTAFVIQASATEPARHVYQRLGFEIDSTSFGLEAGRTPAAATT